MAFAGRSPRRNYLWECKCECGKTTVVMASLLKNGTTKSCFCYGRDQRAKSRRTHGKSRTRVWRIYLHMIRRCYNKKVPVFHHYGGRGITVCKRWKKSFEAFLEDMGEPPTKEHSLERINNNKGYSKSNCRWATQAEQTRNTRRTVLITKDGRTMCQNDWCKELGISRNLILKRRREGWPEERWLDPPPRGLQTKKADE